MRKSIVTHSGCFHADDVCSCALLMTCFPDSTIIRSRDPSDWEAGDIVLDVGAVYDPDQLRFDHHQRDPDLPKHPDGIPYSSFGMVFDKFGLDFISIVLSSQVDASDMHSATDYVFGVFKHHIVRLVDAADNMVNLEVRDSTLHDLVSSYNLTWCESGDDMDSFLQATNVVQQYLSRRIIGLYGDWKSLTKSKDIDRSISGLMILDEYFPWKKFVTDNDLFVVFPGKDGNWSIQAIPVSRGSLESKKYLPKFWLDSYPLGCIFVHKGLFFSVFETKESAISAMQSGLCHT